MAERKPTTPKTAKKMTDERDRALYAISVAAELAGVHPQTLRMYERRGLIRPQRTGGMTRRYSQRDVDHVLLIQTLTQEHGMNLAGVERVMEMTREMEELREHMERMQAEMRQAMARLQAEIEQIRRAARAEIVPLRDAQFDPARFAKEA